MPRAHYALAVDPTVGEIAAGVRTSAPHRHDFVNANSGDTELIGRCP